jgi:hypothetical protein
VSFGSLGKGCRPIKNPVKGGIKKAGDEILGQRSIGPKVNAENRSWFEFTSQKSRAIVGREKFRCGGPRNGEDHLVGGYGAALLHMKGSDMSLALIVGKRFKRGGEANISFRAL